MSPKKEHSGGLTKKFGLKVTSPLLGSSNSTIPPEGIGVTIETDNVKSEFCCNTVSGSLETALE